MNFSDRGIILSVKKYSENSVILKILSENHGVYSGFVRGAFSSKKNNILYQNFNLVEFDWKSRIADNLGTFQIELINSFLAKIIFDPIKLFCFNLLASTIENNVLERDFQKEIFDGFFNLLRNLEMENALFLKNFIEFEIELLQILGYGIDLSECAATGTKQNLHFVSPKSAKAVCLESGEKYRDKLLILPPFLLNEQNRKISKDDLLSGLKLSGFFIDKYLNSGVSEHRSSLFKLVENL